MEILVIIGGIILIVAGLVGCFLPVLPGPPIAYLAILLLHFTGFANNGDGFSATVLILLAILSVGILVLDAIIPAVGAKKTGGSRAGVVVSGVGIVVGIFFTAATGGLSIILGPFIGAVIGEMIAGRNSNEAVKAGFGTFLGFLVGTFAKVLVTIIIAVIFIGGLF